MKSHRNNKLRPRRVGFSSIWFALCVVFFFFLAWLAAAWQRSSASWEELKRVNNVLQVQPDSAWIILQGIDSKKLDSKAKKAYYALLRTQAQEECGVPHISDSLMLPAVRYYERLGSANQLVRAYYCMGTVYEALNDMPQAVDFYHQAVQVEGADCNEWIGRAYQRLGRLLVDSRLYKEGIEAYQKAFHLAPDIQNQDVIQRVVQLQDSIQQNGQVEHVNRLEALYQHQRMEKEHMSLALQHERSQRQLFLLLFVSLLILLALILLYFRYRISNTQRILAEKAMQQAQLKQENLSHRVMLLEDECASLKEVLQTQQELSQPIADAIRERIATLNKLLAARIADNGTGDDSYNQWIAQQLADRERFMNTTRLAFKATHPRFIEHLENHGLTEAEMNYLCLYAIGLRGKEVGAYIQLKRHYHVSSNIRKKLGLQESDTNLGIYIRRLMDDKGV